MSMVDTNSKHGRNNWHKSFYESVQRFGCTLSNLELTIFSKKSVTNYQLSLFYTHELITNQKNKITKPHVAIKYKKIALL